MEPFLGTALIWLSMLFGVSTIVLTYNYIKNENAAYLRYSNYLGIAAIASATGAFLYLVYLFVSSDFGVHDAWSLTDTSLPLRYRISAIWSGMNGSMFAWGYIIILTLAIHEIWIGLKNNKKMRNGEEPISRETILHTRLVVSAIAILFGIMVLINDPFTPAHEIVRTDQYGTTVSISPSDYPEGFGLKPVLQNPWMMIHPPLIFFSYAGIILSFGAVFSSFLTGGGKRDWLLISRFWSRVSFLLLTIGIGMGAIWAYTVISWGGYWSWDPKETSALIVWIVLGLFVFAQENMGRYRIYGKLVPIFGIAAFSLMLFGTFVTRSGLWSSVPIYMKSTSTYIFVFFMASVLIVGSLFIYRKQEQGYDKPANSSPEGNMDLLDMTLIGVVSFVALMLLSVLLRSMDRTFDHAYYESVLYPSICIALLLLGARLLKGMVTKKTLRIFTVSYIFTAALAGIASPYLFEGSGGSILFLPRESALAVIGTISLFVAGASVISLMKTFRFGNILSITNKLSVRIVIFGILFVLTGYGINSTFAKTYEKDLALGEEVRIGNDHIEWTEIAPDNDSKIGYDLSVVITQDNETSFREVTEWSYYPDRDEITVTPGIRLGLTDVLVSVSDLDPDRNGTIDTVSFVVKEIPFALLIWIGYGAMILGIVGWVLSSPLSSTGPDVRAKGKDGKKFARDRRIKNRRRSV